MANRYRLTTRAQMNGTLREPGYEFTLAEGEKGPHKTVVASNHGAQITDHIGGEQNLVDVPLYVEVEEAATDAPLAAAKRRVDAARDALAAAESELDAAEAAHDELETAAETPAPAPSAADPDFDTKIPAPHSTQDPV